jgi:UDP:flavonoid glycosyltransferase YjiC (YdhE family)
MRFLFSPLPVVGHVSPALRLMRELSTGAEYVAFRSAPDFEWELLNTLFPERPQRAGSGVGLDLKTSRATPEGIRRGVRDVLGQSRYKARAEALRAELQRLDGPTRGAELLERLAATRSRGAA